MKTREEILEEIELTKEHIRRRIMITSKYNSDKDEAWLNALYWVLDNKEELK